MISRRSALRLMATGASTALLPAAARPAPAIDLQLGMRGSIDAGAQGIRPGGGDKMSRKLGELIARAASQNVPLFLPPGDYQVSDLVLPHGSRITGVARASRLVYAGSGFLLRADGVGHVALSNLVIDGANRRLGDETPALVHLHRVADLAIDNCQIIGSSKSALQLEQCGGRIERSRISAASDYGLYALDSVGLAVSGNIVFDCGNGGILIHRRSKGNDGTLVSGNRLYRIGAVNGGTGQYGNAVNLFRADNVMVTGNQISQSAFSAIRANSASNVQIANNHCLGSGETAIYSEFTFEGAAISGNIVDGAANGISVVNFNEGGRLAVISNNLVRNLSAKGPYDLEEAIFGVGISAEADTAITGNVIEGVPLWGMALGFGNYLRNVIATGNIVRQAKVGCAVTVVEGAGAALISGNLFQGMQDGGVIGYRWKAPATGELARGGNEAARLAHLTIENNRVV
ncbi:TIGR03808 family TAT-translocated repetitive protein [Rhizobium deserti]|uniref:TIGR03808 family TAT-translocated repetitive protein n=1 Tax=Rhizobium deserti TaxID=2547961 RepID=A0A4R5UKN2_9HYPH|nr:TIGR03808 family TAT-translocated repetitive protein [Rhizobium deserti]TDK37353.1 TIGR03808 family TAT-translocated repetitive protein [Rhizobium deserti]